MIRTLQRKFIVTAMVAVSVLIIVLLGALNGVNCWRVSNESDRLLRILAEDEGVQPEGELFHEDSDVVPGGEQQTGGENPGSGPGKRPREHSIFNPAINEDTTMSARFFLVREDADGQIVYTDVSRISSVTEEQAKQYAAELFAGAEKEGRIDEFKYIITDSKDGRGRVVVCLNVSNQSRSILAVLVISAGIGVICWLLMLLLVVVLSKRAIRPIAVNMERQKQFVTDAGHEIKTPLAIILANTEAMELHNGESKWSRNIKAQTNRLSGLMKNLLTLSRMDEGGVQPSMTQLDISRLVSECADSFAESAELKHINIETDIPSGLTICANRENMLQLVSILMDNAVKYSPEQGRIQVVLVGAGKDILLKVRNTCEALPEGEPDKLFDRFYRGDAARTQKNGGYGIGLSVARAIAEAQGGAISAEYGKDGAITFTVRM